jgi:WD40 repeat protein
MRKNNNRNKNIAFLFISLVTISTLLIGCVPSSVTAENRNITSSSTIVNVINTQEISTPIIATEKLATSTPTTPAAQPLQSRTHNGRLSQTGPWMLFTITYEDLILTDIENNPEIPMRYTFTGSISKNNHKGLVAMIISEGGDNPYLTDKSLVILSLPTMTEIAKIRLITFPELPDDENYLREVHDSVITQPEWSPNGRYLAFVAATDGPSGDLYVFDIQTNTVNRLTDGNNQVGHLWWSPDGNWIVHEEISEFFSWKVEAVWAVKYDGSEIRRLYIPQLKFKQEILGWNSPHSFIAYDDTIGFRICQIRYVDIITEEARIIFSGCSHNISWDPSSVTIAVIPYIMKAYVSDEEFQELHTEEDEVYLLSLGNPSPKLVLKGILSLGLRWDAINKVFVTNTPCADDPLGYQAFSVDGTIQCHTAPEYFPSPNGEYYLALDPIIILYDHNGDEISRIENMADKYTYIEWLPDSRGFLLEHHEELYYVIVPELSIKKMQYGPELLREKYVWIYDENG